MKQLQDVTRRSCGRLAFGVQHRIPVPLVLASLSYLSFMRNTARSTIRNNDNINSTTTTTSERRLRNKKLSMSRLANSPRSPRSKSRGKSKGKGKGKASSPGRPAATTANGAGAVRSLTDDMAAIAHTAQNGVVDVDDAMVGDGGGKGTDEKERNGDSASVETGESAGAVARTTMTETAEKAGERYPHGDGRVEAALGNASAGKSTQQSQEHRLRASEPDEEEEEEEEESEEGEQEAGEDEVSFVGSVTAMSERRALSLDDLKALFQ